MALEKNTRNLGLKSWWLVGRKGGGLVAGEDLPCVIMAGGPAICYLVVLACLPNGKGSKGNLNALIPLGLIMGICNR